jgi:hypothetical protein
MKRIINSNDLIEIKGGDLRGFCTGWIAGVGVGLSFGWTLGPVGIGVVVLGAGVCLAADKSNEVNRGNLQLSR